MRVNITHSVDIDEIPIAIKRKLENININIANMYMNHLTNDMENENLSYALHDIDKIREFLNIVDEKLSDCYNILSEYLKIKSNQFLSTSIDTSKNEDIIEEKGEF